MHISTRLWRFAIILFATCAFAADAADPLTQMTSQERRFAELCKQVGIRDSFLAFFDDQVITFGPELRVGTAYLKSRPPNSPSSPLLEWQPVYADVAASGDLGYTTGPATLTLHPDDPAAKKVVNLMFFSIWHKNSAGDWKVIFDGGLTTPLPLSNEPFHRAPAARSISTRRAASGQKELLDTERKFSDSVEKNGFVPALDSFAEPTVRVQRDNHFPAQGIAQSRELLKDSASYKFVTREAVVAVLWRSRLLLRRCLHRRLSKVRLLRAHLAAPQRRLENFPRHAPSPRIRQCLGRRRQPG